MTTATEIMRGLWNQVFQPDKLNASLLIDKKYGGKAEHGFSSKTTLKYRKRIVVFIKLVSAFFEFLMMVVGLTKLREQEIKKPKDSGPKLYYDEG